MLRITTPPDCIMLDKWVFENFILADELFAKALRIFETSASVSNNLCEKLVMWKSDLMKDSKLLQYPF